jgi:signal transduction histidine kinase
MKRKPVLIWSLFLLLMCPLFYYGQAQEGDVRTNADVEQLLEEAHQKRNDEPSQAEKLCKRVLERLEKDTGMQAAERNKLKVRALNTLVWTGYILGSYEKAIDTGNQSIEIAQANDDTPGMAMAYKNMGLSYMRLGKYNEALSQFVTALELFRRVGNKTEMDNCYNNIGLTFYEKGQPDQSLFGYLKGMKMFEETGDKGGMGVAYNNIGLLHIDLKNYDKALEYLNKALAISREMGEIQGVADNLDNIGMVYYHKGNDGEALKSFERALAIYRQANSPAGIATIQLSIGNVYLRQKQYSKALTSAREALAISRRIRDQKILVHALLNMGGISLHQHRFAPAVSYYEEALALSKEIQTTDQLLVIYRELSQAYEGLNNHRKALQYYKLHKQANDKIYNEKNAKQLAEAELKYNSEKNEKEIQLLKKDREIQNLALDKVRNVRNLLLAGVFIVALILLLLYNRQKTKARVREEQLKHQQLESMSLLSGGIAHDFNNLLAVIVGYLDLLKEKVEDDEDNMRMVEIIEKSAQQGVDLASKFLDLSRSGWTPHRQLTIKGILDHTAHRYPAIKHLLKHTSIPHGLKLVSGDNRQLSDMFFNILENADEATGDPKLVIIEAGNITIDPRNDYDLEPGDYIKISITDNGKGISAEHLEKIFDPYFSTKNKPSQKGMGLGLAICYSIVKKHKGHIRVTSDPGTGSTVTIFLPAA